MNKMQLFKKLLKDMHAQVRAELEMIQKGSLSAREVLNDARVVCDAKEKQMAALRTWKAIRMAYSSIPQ